MQEHKYPGQLLISDGEHFSIMIAKDGVVRYLVVFVPFKEIYYLS